MSEWKPISTAPMDGTIVLLAGEFDAPNDWRIKMGYYQGPRHGWYLFGGSWNPSMWMKLPDAPDSNSESV